MAHRNTGERVLRTCACVCSFFSACVILLLGPEHRLSLFPSHLPLLLFYRSIPLFFLPLIWFFFVFVWFLRGTDRDPQLSRVDRVRKRVADG